MSLNVDDTFICISMEGSDYIYDGQWGQTMVNMVNQYGGNITVADLANYDALYLEPSMTEYDIYDVYSSNISYNNAHIDLFEQENILAASEIHKHGTDYGNNATILAYMMEITRWNMAEI